MLAGVSFSWFDRMDITLRSSSQAALSGSTSTLMSQQSVCHSCYEIYITEQKLMRAEKLFAKATGVPDRPRRNGRGGKDVVKNMAIEDQGHKVKAEEPQEVPNNLQCYRFLTLFGDVEQLPVPLIFGLTGLQLQYTFMGMTTTMPLDVEGATLDSTRMPGATKEDPSIGGSDSDGSPGKIDGEGGQPEPEPESEPESGPARAPGTGTEPEPEPEPEPESESELDGEPASTASQNHYTAEKVDVAVNRYGQTKEEEAKDVRVKRSLFSGKAEKLRREQEEREEKERKRLAWEKEMEEKEKEEQKRQRAAERRKAELAMKKAEEVWPLCVRFIAAFATHRALSAGSVETGG